MAKNKSGFFLFPKWTNQLPLFIVAGLFLTVAFIVFVFWFWFSPRHLEVGYEPDQPIPFSHMLHAGELGLDCRYCHYTVENAAHAAIPPTDVCMNCHSMVKQDSPHIAKLKESFETGKPIEWAKVHALPDYVYFDHSRHINAGVSCVSCHGRVDQMEKVRQVEPLSMSWCLECHREPENHVRPLDQVTNLGWKAEHQKMLGEKLVKERQLNPGESCSVCHR